MAMTAHTLPEADAREVLRCPQCGLQQFMTKKGNCRKCRVPLHVPEVVTDLAPAEEVKKAERKPSLAASIAAVPTRVRDLRKAQGLSQRDLAKRMDLPRTWISKVENGKCMPNLQSLDRIASALQVSTVYLLVEDSAAAITAVLQGDSFLTELMPFVSALTDIDRYSLIDAAKRMAARTTGRAA